MIITPETENDMFKLFLENLSSIRMVYLSSFWFQWLIAFTFFSRYVNQSTMVDHIFPPQNADMGHVCSSHAMVYSTFTYWREPVEDIQLHFEDETKKTDTNDDKKDPLETVPEEVSLEAKNA